VKNLKQCTKSVLPYDFHFYPYIEEIIYITALISMTLTFPSFEYIPRDGKCFIFAHIQINSYIVSDLRKSLIAYTDNSSHSSC